MQLGITAGQPDRIAIGGGSGIGEQGEGQDLGAGLPPTGEEVRVNEREGLVLRQGDALPGRRQRNGIGCFRKCCWARGGNKQAKIDIMGNSFGDGVEALI